MWQPLSCYTRQIHFGCAYMHKRDVWYTTSTFTCRPQPRCLRDPDIKILLHLLDTWASVDGRQYSKSGQTQRRSRENSTFYHHLVHVSTIFLGKGCQRHLLDFGWQLHHLHFELHAQAADERLCLGSHCVTSGGNYRIGRTSSETTECRRATRGPVVSYHPARKSPPCLRASCNLQLWALLPFLLLQKS